jgi:hypothetical protein
MVLGWSANIRKLAKNHKGYGSAAQELIACLKTVSILVEIKDHKGYDSAVPVTTKIVSSIKY